MQSPGRWRRAVVVGAAGMSFASAALAAAPAPEPANEDAIATARRDYEAIKAAGAGAEQQKLALPRQELPQLDLKPADEPVALPAMTARKDEAERLKKERAGRSRTWLLDAMKEPGADGSGRVGTGEPERLEALKGSGTNAGDFLTQAADLAQESERSRREDKTAGADQKLKAEVVNPLSAFMASWMTPRDLELLKATPAAATDAGLAGTPPVAGGGNLSATTAAAGPVSFSLPELAPSDAGSAARFEALKSNPYLTDFASVAPGPVGPQASLLSTAEPAMRVPETTPAPESPPAAVPATPGADWSKAKDDEKYFKQLKRF